MDSPGLLVQGEPAQCTGSRQDAAGLVALSGSSERQHAVVLNWSACPGRAGNREGRVDQPVDQEAEKMKRFSGSPGQGQPEQWAHSLQPA